MNKQQLIEKAVIDLDGEFSKSHSNLAREKGDDKVLIWFNEEDKINFTLCNHICTREEFNAAADRMRGKPDWSKLPEIYNWISQDHDGRWWAYEAKPAVNERFFSNETEGTRADLLTAGKCLGDWRNTLEKRPEQKVEQITASEFFEKNAPTVYGKREKPAPTNPWFEAGELPPIGVECEINFNYGKTSDWHVGTVTYRSDKFTIIAYSDGDEVCYDVNVFDCLSYRPIRTDRQQLIDIIESVGNQSNGVLADAILAAGWGWIGK